MFIKYFFIPVTLCAIGFILGFGTDNVLQRVYYYNPIHIRNKVQPKYCPKISNLHEFRKFYHLYPRSWRISHILLNLHDIYLQTAQNYNKNQTIYCIGNKLFKNTLLYPFWVIEFSDILIKSGNLKQSKKILSLLQKSKLWIEPEILMQLGEISYMQNKKDTAFYHWQKIAEQYPYSKVLKKIERKFSLLKRQLNTK